MACRPECFSTLARLFERPEGAFVDDLARATDATLMPPDVAAQVALFASRTGDLALEERQELFSETFASAAASTDRCSLAARLRQGAAEGPASTASLDRLSDALLRDGNPYHHLIVAARMLFAA